jgi:plastocyanin
MRLVAVRLVFVLATCVASTTVWSQPTQGPAVAPESISIRLSNFAFTPDRLRLRVGVPFRLRFVNDSGGGHNFTAPAFFAASAVVGGSPPPDRKMDVAAGTTVELTLVPRVAGTYPVECTHFLHSLFGMKGTIEVIGPTG